MPEATRRHGTASKRLASRFLRTLDGFHTRPFMAIQTPSGSACTAPTAQPMLNTASEPVKRAGFSAPVSTMTLPTMPTSACAVSTMVSVPCVTSTWRSLWRSITSRSSARSEASMCSESLRSSGITLKRKATPIEARICPICGSPI